MEVLGIDPAAAELKLGFSCRDALRHGQRDLFPELCLFASLGRERAATRDAAAEVEHLVRFGLRREGACHGGRIEAAERGIERARRQHAHGLRPRRDSGRRLPAAQVRPQVFDGVRERRFDRHLVGHGRGRALQSPRDPRHLEALVEQACILLRLLERPPAPRVDALFLGLALQLALGRQLKFVEERLRERRRFVVREDVRRIAAHYPVTAFFAGNSLLLSQSPTPPPTLVPNGPSAAPATVPECGRRRRRDAGARSLPPCPHRAGP